MISKIGMSTVSGKQSRMEMLSTANYRNKTSRSDTRRKLGAPCTYKYLQLLPVARIFKNNFLDPTDRLSIF